MAAPRGTVHVVVTADVRQGSPFWPTEDRVTLPASLFARHEEIYRVADASLTGFGALEGDLLIVEPRDDAHTGELVLVRKGENVYVGRWWAKHGRRDVLADDTNEVVVKGATILGSVNLIGRGFHADHA